MKGIYWRPKQISPRALALIAVAASVSLLLVEVIPHRKTQLWQQEKLEASQLALRGFETVREARLSTSKKYVLDPLLDPTRSGLIGLASSMVSTSRGSYLSKRTSINPNFAGVMVDMLQQAEVKRGDKVAVALSGSFPALNICTLAAMQTLGLDPVIVSSGAASEWGANDPDFLWLDMERALQRREIFNFRSVAASLGGMDDRAAGLSSTSIGLIKAGIERNAVDFIESESLEDGVKKRLEIFKQKSPGFKYAAYINVGGGQGSTGGNEIKEAYKPGLNFTAPEGVDLKISVMGKFSQLKIPVIHMIHIQDLAINYQLPQNPVVMPEPGQGGIFERISYNRFLAGLSLAFVLGLLTVFVRTHWGAQFLRPHAAKSDSGDIEAMI